MAAALVVWLCVGCGPSTAPTADEPSRVALVPSSAISPSVSPLTSTNAHRIVDELLAAAGGGPVTKVDITRSAVTLTVQRGDAPAVWTWQAGRITSSTTQSTQTVSRPFNPDDFALDSVPRILATAARVSGSHLNQDLQIVEYNQGTVLMTVSTKPESRAVFFRRDGSLVDDIDFTTVAGMSEAVRDAVAGESTVVQVAYQPDKGLMVDTPTATDGIVMRRTRSSGMPAWVVQRKGDGSQTFDSSLVRPGVLVSAMHTVAPSSPSDASWTMTMNSRLKKPTIQVNHDGTTKVFTADGTDVTATVR